MARHAARLAQSQSRTGSGRPGPNRRWSICYDESQVDAFIKQVRSKNRRHINYSAVNTAGVLQTDPFLGTHQGVTYDIIFLDLNRSLILYHSGCRG